MGQGIVHILMLIFAVYSTYSKLQERSTCGLLTLIRERKNEMHIYQNCFSNLEQQKVLRDKMNSDLGNLQEDMKNMRSDNITDDEAGKLYQFLKEEGLFTDPSTFAKYEDLLIKLAANIEGMNSEANLTTPFWKRVEQFITAPFNFSETLINRPNTRVQKPWLIVERKPNTCLIAFIVELLTRADRLLYFYFQCSAVLGRNAPVQKVAILKQKLLDFVRETFGRRQLFSTLAYDHDIHSVLINYEVTYAKLKEKFKNVDNDSQLDISDSKTIIDFLNDPFENLGPRFEAYYSYQDIVRCYKIEMKGIIKQKEQFSSYYQTCLPRFGTMKQERMRQAIKLYMMDFKMYTEKLRLSGNHGNDVLLRYYDKYIGNLPHKDLQQVFYKYGVMLEFFSNTLRTTKILDDLYTKYWSIVRTFLYGSYNVQGVFNNETVTALDNLSVSTSTAQKTNGCWRRFGPL